MGLLDRFRKEERYSKTTGRFESVQRQPKELTYEEQMEPRRSHPWDTPRGQRVIKTIGGGVQRVDRAIVRYNRRQPRSFSYSTRDNYNPFGSMFDTGMSRPKKTKYVVVGGKAYPKAKTSKKKKRKTTKRRDPFSFDMFDNWGF